MYYYALLARHRYTGASMLQMAGVTARASVTAVVLLEVEASVRAFVAAQLAVAVVHGLLARRIWRADLLRDPQAAMEPAVPHDALSLVKRAAPLALASLAGAAVTQLDKPLIAAFMSSASVVPYFLATTICMTPISLLAAPVAQYFQPPLMRAMSMADTQAVRRLLARFTLTLVGAVGVPGLCLWLLAAPAVNLWLGAGTLADSVARYVSILLPGFILGGLGFVPYSLVLAAEDFRFQARLSVVLTAATLLAAAFFAFRQSLTGICVVYVIYYAAATIATWLRATQLPETRELASFSSHRAIASGTVLVAAAGITAFIFR
jgi:O-antigen/teichoic acid export membrane protein